MPFDPSWAFRDCTWCQAHDVQMNIVTPLTTQGTSSGQRSWTALACPRCARLTILEHTGQGTGPAMISILPRDEDVQHDVDHLPADIAAYYADARKALDVGLPDLAAVALRKTLEAATAAHGANDRLLVKRVRQLIEDGHVTRVFDPALGYIRKVGNVGAHAGDERLAESEVRQALTFTTLLLRNLFELPGQIAQLEAEAPPPPAEGPE